MAIPCKQNQKNEEFRFTQEMAEVWRVLPHADHARALAVVTAIKERLENLDFSKYVQGTAEGPPPIRRIV